MASWCLSVLAIMPSPSLNTGEVVRCLLQAARAGRSACYVRTLHITHPWLAAVSLPISLAASVGPPKLTPPPDRPPSRTQRSLEGIPNFPSIGFSNRFQPGELLEEGISPHSPSLMIVVWVEWGLWLLCCLSLFPKLSPDFAQGVKSDR